MILRDSMKSILSRRVHRLHLLAALCEWFLAAFSSCLAIGLCADATASSAALAGLANGTLTVLVLLLLRRVFSKRKMRD